MHNKIRSVRYKNTLYADTPISDFPIDLCWSINTKRPQAAGAQRLKAGSYRASNQAKLGLYPGTIRVSELLGAPYWGRDFDPGIRAD